MNEPTGWSGGLKGVHRLNSRLRTVKKAKHRPTYNSETASALKTASCLMTVTDRKFPRE